MAPKRHAASSAAAPAPVPAAPAVPTTIPSKSLSSGPATLKSTSSPFEIGQHVWQQYLATTPQRTLLLDAFMAFLVLVGGIQFVYCVLAGNYPFNAFLSGFCAAVGQFVLTASLRMQTSSTADVKESKPSSKGKNVKIAGERGETVSGVSHERAFADYVFGSLILHFFCINFIN